MVKLISRFSPKREKNVAALAVIDQWKSRCQPLLRCSEVDAVFSCIGWNDRNAPVSAYGSCVV
jgi:hypothetical protein